MKHLSSLLFISLVLFSSPSWAQTPSSAKDFVDRCISRYRQKDMDGATADCSKAIELNPRLTDAYAVRASILAEKGNLEGAIADLDKAAVLDPHNPTLYRARGFFKLTKRDLDGAIADFGKLIDMDSSPLSYMGRAMAYGTKGNYDKAIDDLNIAVEKSHGSVELYTLRAQIKFRKKDWGGSIVDYTTAIKLDPKPSAAYFYRGLALLNQGEDTEAQKDFDKFLELDPDKKAFLEKSIEQTKRERTIRK